MPPSTPSLEHGCRISPQVGPKRNAEVLGAGLDLDRGRPRQRLAAKHQLCDKFVKFAGSDYCRKVEWQRDHGVAPSISLNVQALCFTGELRGSNEDTMKTLAYSNNIPFIDVWNGVFGGTYQAALMFDDKHCNTAGYTAIANFILPALAAGFKAA